PADELLREPPRLLLARPVVERGAVEVDEVDGAPAAHHPPRRDRRVDAAGQEREHPAARSDREPPRARDLLEREERAPRQHVDGDRERAMIEIDARARRTADARAEPPANLRRPDREALVGPLRLHAKALDRPRARGVDDRVDDGVAEPLERRVRVGVERDRPRQREVREPEDAPDAPARLRPRATVVERQHEPRRRAPHGADGQPCRRADDLVDEPPDEVGTVPALQRDLVIAHHDEIRGSRHGLRPTTDGTLARQPMIDALAQALAGALAARERAVLERPESTAAAVLVPLLEIDGEPHLLFTRRASWLTHHQGQVAFPGGRHHPEEDRDLATTALREAHEEIGLDPAHVRLLGALDDIETIATRYVITP